MTRHVLATWKKKQALHAIKYAFGNGAVQENNH